MDKTIHEVEGVLGLHNLSSLEEQIRQLDMNGKKLLRSQKRYTGSPLRTTHTAGTAQTRPGDGSQQTHNRSQTEGHDRSLNNSSAGKTMMELRAELDYQKSETVRLEAQMKGDNSHTDRVISITHSPGKRSGYDKSVLASLPVPLVRDMERHSDRSTIMQLERAVKDAQLEISDLKQQLEQSSEQLGQRSEHFRSTMAELRTQLHEVKVNRDSLLHNRQRESAQQEALIEKLQARVDELDQQTQRQQQLLTESESQHEQRESETLSNSLAVQRLHQLLVAAYTKHGGGDDGLGGDLDSLDGDVDGLNNGDELTMDCQSASVLVQRLEQCFMNLERRLDDHILMGVKLEQERDIIQQTCADKETLLKEEHRARLGEILAEHDKQQQATVERASNSRLQSNNLQEQLHALQQQYDDEKITQESLLTGLEAKLSETRQELDESKTLWHAQMTIAKLQSEVDAHREKHDNHNEREEKLEQRLRDTEVKLSVREEEVGRLEREVTEVREGADQRLAQELQDLEQKHHKIKTEEINEIKSSLEATTQKYTSTKQDLEIVNVEIDSLREQTKYMESEKISSQAEVEKLQSDKRKLEILSKDLTADVERLTQERDYYFENVERSNHEIAELKARKERAEILLDEKDKNVQTMQQQTSQVSQILELNTKNTDQSNAEKERLLQIVTEKTAELEKLHLSRETTVKKLKIREKRVKDLEDERRLLHDEIDGYNREMKSSKRDNSLSEGKVRGLEERVVAMTAERDKYYSQLDIANRNFTKLNDKMKAKLEASENDLSLSKKTLKSKETVENKAVKLVDKLQKEVTAKRAQVDHLQTQMRWLEERVDTLTKEKKRKDKEREKFRVMSERLLTENKGLSEEVDRFHGRNQELKEAISQLEGALEKSAVSHANSEARVQRMGQDMAKSQIGHQLQLKEVQQTTLLSQSTRSPHPHPTTSLPQSPEIMHTLPTSHIPQRDNPESNIANEAELRTLLTEMRSLVHSHHANMAAAVSQSINDRNPVSRQHTPLPNPTNPIVYQPSSAPEEIDQKNVVQLCLKDAYGNFSTTGYNDFNDNRGQNISEQNKNNRYANSSSPYNVNDMENESEHKYSDLLHYTHKESQKDLKSLQNQRQQNQTQQNGTEQNLRQQNQRQQNQNSPSLKSLDETPNYPESHDFDSNWQPQYHRRSNAQVIPSSIDLSLSADRSLVRDGPEYSSRDEMMIRLSPLPDFLHTPEQCLTPTNRSLTVHSPPVRLLSPSHDTTESRERESSHALCERLEKQMEELAKMGGSLQRDNREMASLIASQDQGIRNVKDLQRNIHLSPK